MAARSHGERNVGQDWWKRLMERNEVNGSTKWAAYYLGGWVVYIGLGLASYIL